MNTATSKTALITGASGGIGNAIAEQFARDGVNVIITARKQQDVERIATEWESKYKVRVTPIAAELSSENGAQQLFNDITAKGISIDYLVNNAGVGLFGEFTESDLDAERKMMTLNMSSPIVLAKLFCPSSFNAKAN